MKNDKVNEWQKVGTFAPSSWRRVSKNRSPADILILRLKELVPEAQSISEFGCSKELNLMLKKELKKWAKKYTYLDGRRLESAVAFTMLDTSPSDIEGIKGKAIFWRKYP
jgi:hypothetical protein